MKKGIFKGLVIAGLVATAPMAFSGCGKKDPTISDYEITGHTANYYLNDNFSIVGTTLKLIMSDGTEKEITVTEEMIKQMPDMTTEGTKEIVIVYDGKEYTFTIVVAKKVLTKEEKVAKLKNALTQYLTTNKTNGITASVNFDMLANYLGDSVEYKDIKGDVALTDAQVAEIKELKPGYDTIIKLLLQSSLDVKPTDVLDGEAIKTNLDILKTLENFTQDINTPEKAIETIYNYINNSVMYEQDYVYINGLTNEIAGMCGITSEAGKAEVKYIATTLVNSFRNKQQFNAYELIANLNDAIQQHSEWPEEYKVQSNAIVESFDELDVHVLSKYINGMSSLIKAYGRDNVQRTDLDTLVETYVTKVADVIYELENVQEVIDVAEFLSTLQTKVQAVIDIEDQFNEEEVLLKYGPTQMYVFTNPSIASILNSAIKVAQNESKQAVLDVILSYDWVSYIPEESPIQITQDSYEMVLGLIYDAINQNEIDYEKFIVDFANEYEFDAQKYLDQYEVDGKTTLCADLFDTYVDLTECPQEGVTFFNKLRDVCVYIDNLSAKEEYIAEDIVTECMDLIHQVATAGLDWAESDEVGGQGFIDAAKIISILSDTTQEEPIDNIKNLIKEYRTLVEEQMLYISYPLMIEPETEGYEVLSSLITKHVGAYLQNTFDYSVLLNDASDFVKTYCNQEVKTIVHSLAVLGCVATYDESIDYNEIFSFVELPNAIENIDYNVLMKKLVSVETYQEMLKVSNIEVEHVFNENGTLDKEVYTITLSLDFDAIISSVNADVKLTLEIDL